MFQIETGRQAPSGIELAICELCEPVVVKAFRRLALSVNNKLIVLYGYIQVFFRNTGKNCPQIQVIIVPTGLDNRSERPRALSTRSTRSGLSLVTVEIIKHLVDRTAELIQRLPNIIAEQSAQHTFLLGFEVEREDRSPVSKRITARSVLRASRSATWLPDPL